MPMYEFESKDGDRIERFFNMSDNRPEVIETKGTLERHVDKDGVEIRKDEGFDEKDAGLVRFTRDYGGSRANCHENMQYPYASLRLKGQISTQDAKHENCTVRGVPHTGVPIIRSKKHEDKIAKKYGLVRE